MRINIIAGNWKMNSSRTDGIELVNGVLSKINELTKTEVIFAPPFVYLSNIAQLVEGKQNVYLSSQNMSDEDSGAYTGEISHAMLSEVGCKYVILGHSERRQYYGEDNAVINRKLLKALQNCLKPILCCGETFEEYEAGKTVEVIQRQVTEGLASVSESDMANVVIAYEPIWAIGTGKTSTPENANKVHGEIRNLVRNLYNSSVSEETRILYGGSVKASNSAELLQEIHIDGALVGGASLKADEFAGIIQSSEA